MKVGLTLGPLEAEGFAIRRSGLRWLRPDGHACRPGEVIAMADISLAPRGGGRSGPAPFADERTLQVAFAPPAAGRLKIDPTTSTGGHLDFFGIHDWRAEEVVGHLETASDGEEPAAERSLRRLILAGRRMAWAVDVDTVVLPGWNLRARAWWGEAQAPLTTLVSVGICDATGFIRGDQGGFVELFEMAPYPAHIVHISEHPIAPCAPILLEQFARTPAQFKAIAGDLRRALGQGPVEPTPEDYVFAGAFLAQLGCSPLRERHEILGPKGLARLAPAGAVLLSAASEPGRLLRHRRLGYAVQVFDHNLRAAGPAMRAWIAAAFETVTRSLDDIRRDLALLVDEVHAETGAQFLVINRMSTSGRETISDYGPFDAPLGATLETVAAKELNLMLHDLCVGRPVSIVDLDALGAALGGGLNLPDGIHQSGLLQRALRREVLTTLATACP